MKNPLREQRLSKKFVALLLCVTVCFSLAVGSYLTRGTVFVGNLTEVWQNPPFSSPNWQVGQVNATYFYTQNCTSGQWAYEGTNATLAVQYALDRGGRIVVSSGTFKVYGNIEPKSNCYLLSQPDTIFLKVNSAGNQITSLAQASSLMYRKANYKLENFTVDGGVWNYNKPTGWKTHRTDANWTTYYNYLQGIFLGQGGAYTPENVVVKNLLVKNILGYGIMLYMCHNGRVDNCRVYDCGDNGISISASNDALGSRWVHDVVVSNCFVRGAADVGINCFYGQNVKFIGNSAILNTQTGGSHWGIAAEGKSSQIVIDDCYAEGNDYNIVVSGGTKNVTISNCVVNGTNGSNRYGVELQDCQNVVVIASQFLGCGVSFGTYGPTQTYDVEFCHNIVVSGYMYIHGHGVTIDSNNIYSTSTNGAIFLHGAVDVIIQNNNFRGTYGVRDFGIVSTQVVIEYNDFSELTGTKVWLQGTVDLTLTINKGLATVTSEYDYIVTKYNSTFYGAFNTATAHYDSLTGNASTTIQYAITNGNSTFIKDGLYIIKPRLVLKSNMILTGESWDAILQAATNLNEAVVYGISLQNVTINNLQIDGNRLAQSVENWSDGIRFGGCTDFTVDHCHIHDVAQFGISIRGSIATANDYRHRITNNLLVDCDWNAIQLGSDDYYAVNCIVFGNRIVNFCDVGISIKGIRCTVSNNQIIINGDLDINEAIINSYWGIATEGTLPIENLIANNVVDYSAFPATLPEKGVGYCLSQGAGHVMTGNMFVGDLNCGEGIRVVGDNCTISGGSVTEVTHQFLSAVVIASGANYTMINGLAIKNVGDDNNGIYFASLNSKTVCMGVTFQNVGTNFAGSVATGVKYKDCFDFDAIAWIPDV